MQIFSSVKGNSQVYTMDVKGGTIPKTNNFAPENGWLESMKFRFGLKGLFSGVNS